MPEDNNLLSRLVHYVEENFHNGDRLPSERDLADQFGVGRSQVRESLSKLEAYRLVIVRPKSRAVVTRDAANLEQLALRAEVGAAIDLREIRQAIEVRRIVEMAAVPLACERAQESNWDRLEIILGDAQKKIAASLPIALEDESFHLEVIRATQNDILVQTAAPFYAMTRARRRVYFADSQRCKASHAEHLKLYAALRQRDEVRAIALITGHLRGAADHWAKLAGKQAVAPRMRRRPA